MLSSLHYKKATLHIPNDRENGTWFVIWYNTNPATKKLERIRKTFNLNRIDDIQEREQSGRMKCTLINEALKNGWNYYTRNNNDAANKPLFESVADAIEYAYKRQCATTDREHSRKSYKTAKNLFNDWILNSQYKNMLVGDLSPHIIMEWIDNRKAAGSSNTTVNNYIRFLHRFFQILKKMKAVTENPFASIEALPESESEQFEIITPQELAKISKYIRKKNPHYLLYLRTIYWAAIRPTNLGLFKGKQIDYGQDLINNRPGTAKNKKQQLQQLLPPLKNALIEMKRDKTPDEWYLFGMDFKPAATSWSRIARKAGELWREYVQRDLGINKKMYALKYSFNQHYLMNNEHADLDFLQRHNKHSSLQETDIYVRKRKVKMIEWEAVTVPVF